MKPYFIKKLNKLPLALAISVVISTPAFGQEEGNTDLLALEEVIATGVATPTTKLESSVSVSSLSGEAIGDLAPRSAAEIFRSIPGIRSESSGGGGNANITIRGIPLATGGAKFLQIHEDGLRVIEFGDINFGNADNFIRYDTSIAKIESIRGGSASTFASNSPGGVINLITKTGEEEGGSVSLSLGTDYQEFRSDFEYGGPLTDSLRFYVGGFVREGEGTRDTGFNGDSGGQIKANVTKEFENGYIRFHVKRLDDKVETYLPAPVEVQGEGEFGPVNGFDASTETQLTSRQTFFGTFDVNGNFFNRNNTNGIESKVNAFGLEFNFDLGDNFNIDNRFRNIDITGGFTSPITQVVGPVDQVAQAARNGGLGTGPNPVATFVTGTNAGQVYTGLAQTIEILDVSYDDLGGFVNDLKFTYDSDNIFSATIGLYNSKQELETSWHQLPRFLTTVEGGGNGQLLDVTQGGQQFTYQGFYVNNFTTKFDVAYDIIAPYFNIGLNFDRLNLDFSYRQDTIKGVGVRATALTLPSDIDNDGDTTEPFEGVQSITGGAPVLIDSDYSYDSFSAGANFSLTDDMAIFGRFSEGSRAAGDRTVFIGGAFDANGNLDSGFETDDVEQIEIGYKLRLDNLGLFVTLFDTVTEEANFDITTNQTVVREYDATGLEIEAAYQMGGFELNGNITFTDAEISADAVNPAFIGNQPRRQADLIYTITPAYRADNFSIGANLVGSSEFFVSDVNNLKQDAYTVIHAFASYRFNNNLSIRFNINNLTDEFIVTEVEEGTGTTGDIVRGRPLSGRTSNFTIKYDF